VLRFLFTLGILFVVFIEDFSIKSSGQYNLYVSHIVIAYLHY